MPKPQTIAGFHHSSLAELHKRISQVVAFYADAQPGTRLLGRHELFVLDLVRQRHPDAPEILEHVTAVRVDLASFGGRRFALERADGSRVAITWRRCFGEGPLKRFTNAARAAIAPADLDTHAVNAYLTERALDLESVAYRHSPPDRDLSLLADPALVSDFLAYHSSRAQ